MQKMQYSLGALLIVVTIAAILCSLVKLAADFYPEGFLRDALELAVVTVPMSAIPAAMIGRRIGRTILSVYLGISWGVLFATLMCIPEILGELIPLSPSSTLFVAIKAAVGGMLGGWFGGCATWWIVNSQPRVPDDVPTLEKEPDQQA
jgi:hypothetical protein